MINGSVLKAGCSESGFLSWLCDNVCVAGEIDLSNGVLKQLKNKELGGV